MLKNRLKLFIRKFVGGNIYNIAIYNYLRLKVKKFPRIPNLRKPQTFNEKIIYLKLNHRVDDASILADKYLVRFFVEQSVGRDTLIPLLGSYDDPADIDFSKLPNQFVIKPNHGSGMILFCNKDTGIDESHLVQKLHSWLLVDYGELGGEYQYSAIKRKILIEEDMRFRIPNGDMNDYKLFCFDGEPKFIQVDIDRFSDHARDFYDLEWRRMPFSVLYKNSNEDAAPPKSLNRMVEIARLLSEGLPFARIDLYDVNGRVFFGEITFHPGGGVEPFFPEKYDHIIGSYLNLPGLPRSQ